ncbi:hypothetical protein QNH05_gp03 [Escherichia phage vB_EcoM_DE15]|uniref:Uncharacterized protein n=1 Tax=Escherichia phage vB_EcoM_DE15 TaxID=3003366 RepID=A0AAF0AGV7_9CAUD|nr:hypothetical protein QNH05_gp03 [Escherichia phage vB_EcoM_DE15]WAX24518.1 hypothetical protein [Escherichia phage vB_EcoM_DE15]
MLNHSRNIQHVSFELQRCNDVAIIELPGKATYSSSNHDLE